MNVADALESRQYQEGDVIIRQVSIHTTFESFLVLLYDMIKPRCCFVWLISACKSNNWTDMISS